MNKRSARPDVDANRDQYRVTECAVGDKLWLELTAERNLAAVTVTRVTPVTGGQRVVVTDLEGNQWELLVGTRLTGTSNRTLYTHWFSLF